MYQDENVVCRMMKNAFSHLMMYYGAGAILWWLCIIADFFFLVTKLNFL